MNDDNNDVYRRPAARIVIEGPDGEVEVIDAPELVIDDPYPSERLEADRHENEEN